MNTAVFAALAPLAWLLPEPWWFRVARGFAAVHIAARGSSAHEIELAPAVVATGLSARSLERSLLAGKYLETMQMLREHRPGGWNAPIRLVGTEHLEQALVQGRGVVLWVASCNFTEINAKKALHAAGWPATNLRSYEHPYSCTRFGRAVLNRLRTSVEDRYLAATVTLYPWNAPATLRQLQLKLRENAVVSITASSASDRPFRLGCLGGTLSLALGGPTLALLGNAPLLPVFATPSQDGEYRVEVQPELRREDGTAGRTPQQRLASAFVPRLEAFVRRHPTVWRGWFIRNQWQPGIRADVPKPPRSTGIIDPSTSR